MSSPRVGSAAVGQPAAPASWSAAGHRGPPRHPSARRPLLQIPPAGLVSVDELSMLALLADGHVMEVVARRLGLSERTLRRRLRVLCDRVSATSTVQVIAWAARNHWI